MMNENEMPTSTTTTTTTTATTKEEEVSLLLPRSPYCLSDEEKSALCKSYEDQIDVLKSNLNMYSEVVDEKERKIEK